MVEPDLYRQPHSDVYRIVRRRDDDTPAALALIRSERSRAMTWALIGIVALVSLAFCILYLLVTQPAPSVRSGRADWFSHDARECAVALEAP